jgi:hypothetical protein
MNQAFTGAAIAAVVAVCWLLGRPRRPLLRSTDASAVAALNRGQIERLLTSPIGPEAAGGEPSAEPVSTPGPQGAWPRDVRGRGLLLRQLEHQFQQGGGPRRQALAACRDWGDRAALSLIRRGLRDGDPAVVAIAAEAINAFRGRTAAPEASPQRATKAPRNVSRTR